jgi:hypothetical protein
LLSIDVVGAPAIPAELEGWKPQGRFVRLQFVTSTNVRDIARELELHVGAHAYLCDSKSHQLEMLRVVFDDDGAINDSPIPSSRSDGSQIWFFITEAASARKDINTGELSIPPYDLRKGQQDVCVSIRGRSMSLVGFSSNVVRIDSETMKKALATGK